MPEPEWKRRLSDDVEVAIGISVNCGGTRGVHYVRDAVLRNVLPHIEAAYKRGLEAGRSQKGYSADPMPLAGRHLEVARLAAAGLTNPEIARRLFLSPHTVKSHIRAALRRTGARNRQHLTALLAVHGQVTSVNVPNPKENSACPAPAPSAGSPSPASTTEVADGA